jgi:Xaa-Pro aminopeptidase
VVRFDLRCVFKGYCASLGRTAVMGDPDDRQQRAYDAVTAGLEAALAAIRPGATGAQVHAAVVDAARAAGHPGLGGGRVGHGIGLAAWEPPDLGPGSDTALEMGEVLCVQVPWLEAGWAGLAAAETVLVTRVGSHALNRSVRGLVVLD